MSDEFYTCPRHLERTQPRGEWCPACYEEINTARDRREMTKRERVQEVLHWLRNDTLTVPIRALHERIEHLVGKPIMNVELARPGDLIAMIRREDDNDGA